MGRALVPLFALVVTVPGCITPGTARCHGQDADGDGLCDWEDACPHDPHNDIDGDGLCGDVDACPRGHDDDDEDGDGVPDACDPCPGDPLNDADGDGVCGLDDPCPDSADDDCEVPVWLGVQVDAFYADAAWQVLDHRGSLVAGGGFGAPGEGTFRKLQLRAAQVTCVKVSDTFRDGGTRGLVFSRERGVRFAQWTWDDYGGGETFCFTPATDGEPFTPPREEAWVADGACEVRVRVDVGRFPDEVGWALETLQGREIRAVDPGTYRSANQTDAYTTTLAEGEYGLRLLDDAGDGWRADGAGYVVTHVGSGNALAQGTLQDGYAEELHTFRLSCP